MTEFTIPGLSDKAGSEVADILQKSLSKYNDLHLTLKHVHWNVVGSNFIGVHEMIDPQVELVRGYADDVAERIAALGKSPQGTPGAIIKDRTWDDYSVGRDTVQAHLAALDLVYTGVIEDLRKGIDRLEDLDLVSQGLSSARPASWRSSSGSSARTWRTPAVSWPIAVPGPRRPRHVAPRRRHPSSNARPQLKLMCHARRHDDVDLIG